MEKPSLVFCEVGHGKSWWGGNDPGACYNGQTERDIVVEIGEMLMGFLKKDFQVQGVGVETSANLKAKTKYINQVIDWNGYDPKEILSISLHCNASSNLTANGTEVWVSKKATELVPLADEICKSIETLGIKNRGVKQTANHRYGRLYVDDFKCPAILIETAFISNKGDMEIIGTTRGRLQIAEKIYKSIKSLTNIT